MEEWYKVEKAGCRLEASQLKSAEALQRLAALTAVVAVRLLQLRDLAQAAMQQPESEPTELADQNHQWQAAVPRDWILVDSYLARCRPEALTPRQFWLTLAKRGGFIGRKGDGVPGWQTIWKGWAEVMTLMQGFELHREIPSEKSCG